MKVCPACGNRFNTTSSRCPPCHNAYQKEKGYTRKDYLKNKPEILKRLRDRIVEKLQLMREAKSKPCSDCGKRYDYWIMQFDHVRGKKRFNIGQGLYSVGLKSLVEEISKCDVVCSNCHADRTYKRKFIAG